MTRASAALQLLACVVVAACSACATTSATLMAKDPIVPISLTPSVHDATGAVCTDGQGYSVIKKVDATATNVSFAWGIIDVVGPEIDVGALLAKDIVENKADAVVGVGVTGHEHWSGPFATLGDFLPILPFAWSYTVHATLVHFTNAVAATPPAEPSPAEPPPTPPAGPTDATPPPEAPKPDAPPAPSPTPTP